MVSMGCQCGGGGGGYLGFKIDASTDQALGAQNLHSTPQQCAFAWPSQTYRLADEVVLQGKVRISRVLHCGVGHAIADSHSLEVDGGTLAQL
jgi:hypothetical protein